MPRRCSNRTGCRFDDLLDVLVSQGRSLLTRQHLPRARAPLPEGSLRKPTLRRVVALMLLVVDGPGFANLPHVGRCRCRRLLGVGVERLVNRWRGVAGRGHRAEHALRRQRVVGGGRISNGQPPRASDLRSLGARRGTSENRPFWLVAP